MFQQFMQMGAPAAITLVGVSFAFVGLVVALTINGHIKREDEHHLELSRIEAAARARMIEHKAE